MATSVIRSVVFTSLLFALYTTTLAQEVNLPKVRSSRQQEGLYENHPQHVAITGAMVTRFPGDEPTVKTILIRNEKFETVAAGLKAPAGARVVDAEGLHIYAGLIDAYHEVEVPFDKDRGTPYWNDQVRPQVQVAESFTIKDLKTEDKRKLGLSTVLCAPKDGVIKGQSAIMLMLDEEAKPEDAVVDASFAQHFHLTVPRGRGRGGYPNSPMGAVALARQALYDANWYSVSAESSSTEENTALISLQVSSIRIREQTDRLEG